MEKLEKTIKEYADKGFYQDVYKAARQAQIETRLYIQRMHVVHAFDNKSLVYDKYNGHTHNQIIKGSFKTLSNSVNANLYANYFARWYNTGTKSHLIAYGKHRGWMSTHYDPRGAVFENNAKVIERYYQDAMLKYLQENMTINREVK